MGEGLLLLIMHADAECIRRSADLKPGSNMSYSFSTASVLRMVTPEFSNPFSPHYRSCCPHPQTCPAGSPRQHVARGDAVALHLHVDAKCVAAAVVGCGLSSPSVWRMGKQ